MDSITQTQRDRDIRSVYSAIDAVQRLCDNGHGDYRTDKIFSMLREIEARIENLPLRSRKTSRT